MARNDIQYKAVIGMATADVANSNLDGTGTLVDVVVAIKPGYEAAVGFFMETGDIWTGTRMVIHTDDETYLSLVDEMNAVEGFVEREWETTVPTTLTIIQRDSAQLAVGGLPCCETDVELPIEQLLVVHDIRLKRIEQEDADPEV